MYVVHSKTGYDYALTIDRAKDICELKNGFLIRHKTHDLFPTYEIEWERKCGGDKLIFIFPKNLL